MYHLASISDVVKLYKTRDENIAKIEIKNAPFLTLTRAKKHLLSEGIEHGFECSICKLSATHFQYYDHTSINPGHITHGWQLVGSGFNKRSESAPTYFNIDHIIPQSLGGTWQPRNLRITCANCNTKRGNNITHDEIKNSNLIRDDEFTDLDLTYFFKKYDLNRIANWFKKNFFFGLPKSVKIMKNIVNILQKQLKNIKNSLKNGILFKNLKIQLEKNFNFTLTSDIIKQMPSQ
jgi:5-methylcytosine-specific restriction endonuclease McrA